MRITGILGSMLFAMCLAPAATLAADSPINEMIQMYSSPNEFYLFDETDQQTVSFDSEETLKVCARENRHVPSLKVMHDGRSSVVKPGDCQRITAKNFTLTPSGPVDDNWSLEATVEKG